MKRLLLLLMLTADMGARAQMTVDTTKTSVTVKYTAAGVKKTLSIFRSFVAGQGLRYMAVYQPMDAELGEEPEISKLKLSDEVVHIKAMLDAALARKPLNFSRFSINLLPYIDFTTRLADVFTTSKEWNDYVRANAANLRRPITLWDGSEINEIAYDPRVAAAVLEKSDLLKDLAALFAAYGYTTSQGGFPDEHQEILSTDKLRLMNKDMNLFIPVPNTFVNLVKTKK